VLEAVVLTVPDDLTGNRLHAVVRRQPYSELNSIELRDHCKAMLPKVSVPSTVEFVDHALPRSSTGKVDRCSVSVLRERVQHVD
jgi:acyl-CoA synthetase (AMP-forming)/AMP-acid ligase II